MATPGDLSIADIRNYMLDKGGKVTNHALVKHFKRFLTNPETINEARKKFKAYVNILATVKVENGHKYLILREKYMNECPTEEVVQRAIAAATASGSVPDSPGANNSALSGTAMPSPRLPPPYKPPPEVEDVAASDKTAKLETEGKPRFGEACVCPALGEPKANNSTVVEAVQMLDEEKKKLVEPIIEAEVIRSFQSASRANSIDEQSNKENIPRFSFSSGNSGTSMEGSSGENAGKSASSDAENAENPISVKEATQKFNRMASKEDVISPPAKKKPEKQLIEEKNEPEVTLSHPKAKEWIVIMSGAKYQEMAKLAKDYPELVKLQDPSTYTALHWAAKHGNEDVVKLIAGTYKADVNARTNGGYTPLHLAMQFGRVNIFELLCNVYKANRDLMDWSGNKPLDYSKQRTSVSASTYSKIKARRKHTVEKDLGFLRIGSLNVRVKKTTEAFSNFLGVGNGNGSTMAPMAGLPPANHPHQLSHRHRLHGHHHHHHAGTTRSRHPHQRHPMTTPPLGISNQVGSRSSVPISSGKYDTQLHKSWGSADNIPQNGNADHDAKAMMPPPQSVLDTLVKKRQKPSKRTSVASSNMTDSPRDSISSSNSSSNLNSGYSSMPTTPNQLRAPISIGLSVMGNNLLDSDSDSACGFGSNWSMSGRSSLSSGNLQAPRFP